MEKTGELEKNLLSDTPSNFIKTIIDEDLETGRYQEIITRFPPEPNGHLHIGHAKSICLNFGLAKEYKGKCHLRLDDTNPTTENVDYVEAIKKDVKWLGFDWGKNLYHASNYFEELYDLALGLVKEGKAYVCHLNEEDIRIYRGSLTSPGKNSPYRDRSIEENLELLDQMKRGKFKEGECVLRAKIDMSHPNMKMRDPLIYRIRYAHHYRTGDKWCIYPMYDFAHCLSDALEEVTHSICTLEFENNREVYDWFVKETKVKATPHQYEFARLNLNYTVLSKRKLIQLVDEKIVQGWDDPRMPTIAGLRRRGYTSESIVNFCDRIGVAKANSTVDISLLEFSVRNHLNTLAARRMCVLDPIKVVLTNYPEDKVETIKAQSYPEEFNKNKSREIPFTREIYIDRDDFMEKPPKKYHRLSPGKEVRLRYAYTIKCDEVIKDKKSGQIVELRCSCDLETFGKAPDDRKVKGIIHWVSASKGLPCSVRLYDRLFKDEMPNWDKLEEVAEKLNENSFKELKNCYIEPALETDHTDQHFQFERLGFYYKDPKDFKNDQMVFNRVVSLKDTWAKVKSPQQRFDEKKVSESKDLISKDKNPVLEQAAMSIEEMIKELEGISSKAISFFKEWTSKDKDQLTPHEAFTLAKDEDLKEFFLNSSKDCKSVTLLAKWTVNELVGELKGKNISLKPECWSDFINLLSDKTLSGKMGKSVLSLMIKTGKKPQDIVQEQGLKQISDSAEIERLIQDVLGQNKTSVEEYKQGKTKVFGFLVGQVMKASKGQANPGMVSASLKKLLDS